MRKVIIESPYAGDIERNVAYARAAVRDSVKRGEAPYASHLFFTQPGVLNDDHPQERQLGIDAGLAWGECAEATVVYTDLGMSRGMEYGIARAEKAGRPIEYRSMDGWRGRIGEETEMLTNEQLREWERLADGATKGPWVASHQYDMRYVLSNENEILLYGRDHKTRAEDFRFCAAAREAVPELIAEVREHSARIHQLFAALMEIRNRETSADTWVFKTANKAMCEAPKEGGTT